MGGAYLVFQRHSVAEPSLDALAANAKMLAVNPDVLTLWNHRRELLQAAIASLAETPSGTPTRCFMISAFQFMCVAVYGA